MLQVEERVVQLGTRKDSAISELQRELAETRDSLCQTRQQLHATQAEILSME